jgi:two-component system, NarL family, response regulator LiaR
MNPIRVALIEDEELTRMSLKTAFKKYKELKLLGEAKTALEGLDLLNSSCPDVAIGDIGLPDISGIDLIKQYKANTAIAAKIIVLTLHDDQTSVLDAFSAGADSYCMKDIQINLLWEAIKTTYEGNAWIDPAIARIILGKVKIPENTTSSSQISASQSQYRRKDTISKSHPLTERELQVLQLIVDGYSNAEIADELFITVGTVKTHVRNILNKLSADDRTQAAVHALRSGIVG